MLVQRSKYLYSKYGITVDEYLHLIASQQWVCAICKQSSDRKLCVDHIHQLGFKKMSPEDKKKYIRGALCFLCNTGIKGFDKTKDGKVNRNRLEGTYEYFSKYKLKGEV